MQTMEKRAPTNSKDKGRDQDSVSTWEETPKIFSKPPGAK